MAGPATTGVLIYAKNVAAVSTFYEQILNARVLHADEEHRVLQSRDVQLIIQVIPPEYAGSVVIDVPPAPRTEQAIKPFFTVESLESAVNLVERLGGSLCGPIWLGPGMNVRNVCDPEGNILHLREKVT